MTIKNGEVGCLPDAYKLKNMTRDAVILEKIAPSKKGIRLKEKVIKKIMRQITVNIKQDISEAVEQALKEKTLAQLLAIEKEAPKAKLKRTRGCFWLETPGEQILL